MQLMAEQVLPRVVGHGHDAVGRAGVPFRHVPGPRAALAGHTLKDGFIEAAVAVGITPTLALKAHSHAGGRPRD